MASVKITLLGTFQIGIAGRPVAALPTDKARALLAYLALEGGRMHGRSSLAALLWPDLPAEAALRNLRKTLHRLRRALDDLAPQLSDRLLRSDRQVVALDASACAVDALTFQTLLDAVAAHAHGPRESCDLCLGRLVQAAALYRGELLAGLGLADAPEFEEWLLLRREATLHQLMQALYRLAEAYTRRGEYEQAYLAAARQAALDPCHEEAHRQMMRALALSGQPSAALAQYAVCRRALADTLGVEPAAETMALQDRIRRGTVVDAAPHHNLPSPATPLVGRAAELRQIHALLQDPHGRLLTVLGPGGVGKTRLAVHVAQEIVAVSAIAVVFIPLEPLRDPHLVVATIAAALGVRASGSQPIATSLAATLRRKRLLLILDNFEHLASAAAELPALLDAGPGVRLLVTSRVALRLRGERRFPLEPLGLPDPRHLPNLAAIARSPAVSLFVERAQAQAPDFALTAANAPAVAEICARLDGLPLAIELAAARITLMPPQALVARLAQPLALLTQGAHDAPPRQRTLRATIDWSVDLLTEDDRALFRRLAVFSGGFTLRAAAAVCEGAGTAGTAGTALVEGIESLLDKHLIRPLASADGEPRFGMLETIRAYALEHPSLHGELADLQRRHAAYAAGLAEEASPHLYTADRGPWLALLDREIETLRAALAWSTAGAEVAEPAAQDAARRRDIGLRLGGALAWYWLVRGRQQEGRAWLRAVLATAGDADRRMIRGIAVVGAGVLAWGQGDLMAAGALAEESAAIFRTHGDAQWLGNALVLRGMAHVGQGDAAAARPPLEEARVLHAGVGHAWGEALAVFHLGNAAAVLGDRAAAQALYEESLRICRAARDVMGIAVVLHALGALALARGDDATALAVFAESLPLLRASGDRYDLARALVDAGHASLRLGDRQAARELLGEGARLWSDIGLEAGLADALVGLAEVCAVDGQAERAARLLGAAAGLSVAGTVPPSATPAAERVSAAVRAALGEERAAALRATGLALSPERAIDEALGGRPTAARMDRASASSDAPTLSDVSH